MSKIELLPCPKCGGKPLCPAFACSPWEVFAWCSECGYEGDIGENENEARRLWNAECEVTMNNWHSMDTAPETTEWVWGLLRNWHLIKMRYACDLSGEEMPPYQGWFDDKDKLIKAGDVIAWKPIERHLYNKEREEHKETKHNE